MSYELILIAVKKYYLVSVAKQAYSFYGSAEVKAAIKEIWGSLKSIYPNIAEAHFATAMSLQETCKHSKAPEQEIRVANGALATAYNIYLKALSLKKKVGFWIFANEELLFDQDEITEMRCRLFELAQLIAINHQGLGEGANASYWKAKAMRFLDSYVRYKVSELTPEELWEKFGAQYVSVHHGKTRGAGGLLNPGVMWVSYTSYDLNENGRKYVANEEKRIRYTAIEVFNITKIN